jgi:peroxiredoxin
MKSFSIGKDGMRSAFLLFLIGAATIRLAAGDGTSRPLSVGDRAPDFALPFATADSISSSPLRLSELVGSKLVVLAFYPADWSGGCTKEVCTFRDNFAALTDAQVEIVGISGDYVFSHRAWAEHHQLPFKLASDYKHDVARQYGSFNEESGLNRRTVYVIDTAGTIAYIDLAYSTKDLSSFEKLKAAIESIRSH